MTPQREEAERFLRLAGEAAGRLIGSLLAWASAEIANNRDTH